MAVPKSKVSKQRKHLRRASNYTLGAPSIVACPQCRKMHLSHRVCKFCGYYAGKQVVTVSDEKKKAAN